MSENGAADYDLLVIGGGVNGTGIARDAAGRGYSGDAVRDERPCLGYLVGGDEAGARGAAVSRVLRSSGWCMRRWRNGRCCGRRRRTSSGRCVSCCHMSTGCVRHGCCGSDCSSMIASEVGNCCQRRKRSTCAPTSTGKPLKKQFAIAFEYSDGWVNDARLVTAQRRDAADRGALVSDTRTKVISARREGGYGTSNSRARAGAEGQPRGCWSMPPVRGSIR
jgi:glycerol-3-phosphate dehydrogenase